MFVELKLVSQGINWLGKTETLQLSLAKSKDCFLHLTYLIKYMDSTKLVTALLETEELQKEDCNFAFHILKCYQCRGLKCTDSPGFVTMERWSRVLPHLWLLLFSLT